MGGDGGLERRNRGIGRGVMLRRVRKGRLGLPVECGLSASPEKNRAGERGRERE